VTLIAVANGAPVGVVCLVEQDMAGYSQPRAEPDSGVQALYERLNWRPIHAGHYDGIAVTVMQASLRPASEASADGQD
jgi:hypothetical protein